MDSRTYNPTRLTAQIALIFVIILAAVIFATGMNQSIPLVIPTIARILMFICLAICLIAYAIYYVGRMSRTNG